MSRWPGFRFWVFLLFVGVGYVLGDDHSLWEGSDDAWFGGFVRLFGRPISCCTVLCACPLDVGVFCVFCALYRLPNVGQVLCPLPGKVRKPEICQCVP